MTVHGRWTVRGPMYTGVRVDMGFSTVLDTGATPVHVTHTVLSVNASCCLHTGVPFHQRFDNLYRMNAIWIVFLERFNNIFRHGLRPTTR